MIASREFGYATISYEASRIKNQPTGVHALVHVKVNGVTADSDLMNIEKSEERVRLAGKAHRQFGETLGGQWPKKYVETDLGVFCGACYGVWMEQYAPEMMAGAEVRQEISMLVEGLIPEGGSAIIAAPPGRGKSFVAGMIHVSAQHGINQLFGIPKAVDSCYVNLERSKLSMQARLGNINEALGLDRGTPQHFLNARGRGLAEVYDSVERYVSEHNIGFIVLDSISRAGYSGSLTEDVTSNRITDALNALGVTWLGLGHTPRADETHEYGSVMFRAAVDVMIIMTTQSIGENKMGVGLRIDKANDLPTRLPQLLIGMEFDERGLMRAWRARSSEFPELAAGKPTTLADATDDYLALVGWASPSVISAETGYNRTNINSYLAAAPERYTRRAIGHKVEYAKRSWA